MQRCTRCSAPTTNQKIREYRYCDDCLRIFKEIEENEVVVMQRKPRAAGTLPDTFYEIRDNITGNTDQAKTQVQGLATGWMYMEKHDCRGLFRYQDTGSHWLVSEYLDAHPKIAADVKNTRK